MILVSRFTRHQFSLLTTPLLSDDYIILFPQKPTIDGSLFKYSISSKGKASSWHDASSKEKRGASRRKSFQSEERCYLVLLPIHHKTPCHSQCHRAHRFLFKTRVYLCDYPDFRPKAHLRLQALREYLQSDHLAFQLFQLHPRCR